MPRTGAEIGLEWVGGVHAHASPQLQDVPGRQQQSRLTLCERFVSRQVVGAALQHAPFAGSLLPPCSRQYETCGTNPLAAMLQTSTAAIKRRLFGGLDAIKSCSRSSSNHSSIDSVHGRVNVSNNERVNRHDLRECSNTSRSNRIQTHRGRRMLVQECVQACVNRLHYDDFNTCASLFHERGICRSISLEAGRPRVGSRRSLTRQPASSFCLRRDALWWRYARLASDASFHCCLGK
jgi:hypothetical protein